MYQAALIAPKPIGFAYICTINVVIRRADVIDNFEDPTKLQIDRKDVHNKKNQFRRLRFSKVST